MNANMLMWCLECAQLPLVRPIGIGKAQWQVFVKVVALATYILVSMVLISYALG